MSLEKIVQEAMAGRPLEMKEAFEQVIQGRIVDALEEKYLEMTGDLEEDFGEEDFGEEEFDLDESKDEDEEDEDEDEDEEDEDEDEEDED